MSSHRHRPPPGRDRSRAGGAPAAGRERYKLAARIERSVPEFRRRLAVRPGIAGLAQARTGHYLDRPRRKLRHDLLYIRRMNPWLDLRLCAVCLFRALRPIRPKPGRRAGPRRPALPREERAR